MKPQDLGSVKIPERPSEAGRCQETGWFRKTIRDFSGSLTRTLLNLFHCFSMRGEVREK